MVPESECSFLRLHHSSMRVRKVQDVLYGLLLTYSIYSLCSAQPQVWGLLRPLPQPLGQKC